MGITYKSNSHIFLNITAINTITNISAIGIQIGEKIHHQDHVATTPQPPSLSVRKIRNKIVPNPIPFDVFLFSAITFYLKMIVSPSEYLTEV
jgi:hypothetical protein